MIRYSLLYFSLLALPVSAVFADSLQYSWQKMDPGPGLCEDKHNNKRVVGDEMFVFKPNVCGGVYSLQESKWTDFAPPTVELKSGEYFSTLFGFRVWTENKFVFYTYRQSQAGGETYPIIERVQVYDSEANKWMPSAPSPYDVVHDGIVGGRLLYKNKLYLRVLDNYECKCGVFGIWDCEGTPKMLVHDLADGSWELTERKFMITQGTVDATKEYGGIFNFGAENTFYDLENMKLETLPRAPIAEDQGLFDSAQGPYDGKIYFAVSNVPVFIYDIENREWTKVALQPLPFRSGRGSIFALPGALIALGENTAGESLTMLYDVTEQKWEVVKIANTPASYYYRRLRRVGDSLVYWQATHRPKGYAPAILSLQ